jgi:hypothetical protein
MGKIESFVVTLRFYAASGAAKKVNWHIKLVWQIFPIILNIIAFKGFKTRK